MTPPRVVLDANVLFPTVLREILLDVAAAGAFEPVWSPRILEEWRRATVRLGPDAPAIAVAEIAVITDRFPAARAIPVPVPDAWLPDADDIHVLECAVTAGAAAILTRNRRDFPTRVLSRYDILRRDPDEFLLEIAQTQFAVVSDAVGAAVSRAAVLAGQPLDPRRVLKRAGLPRLGKFLDQSRDQRSSS